MKNGVNQIGHQRENSYKMLQNEMTYFGKTYITMLGSIISGTKYNRNKPIFLQKEWLNEIDLA